MPNSLFLLWQQKEKRTEKAQVNKTKEMKQRKKNQRRQKKEREGNKIHMHAHIREEEWKDSIVAIVGFGYGAVSRE